MQVLRGRLAAKGRVGSVRKTGLKCIERQVNCNGHIHLFRIVPLFSHPWHQTQIIEGFVGGWQWERIVQLHYSASRATDIHLSECTPLRQAQALQHSSRCGAWVEPWHACGWFPGLPHPGLTFPHFFLSFSHSYICLCSRHYVEHLGWTGDQ